MKPIYINLENLSLKEQGKFIDGFRKELKTTNNPKALHIDASQVSPKEAVALVERRQFKNRNEIIKYQNDTQFARRIETKPEKHKTQLVWLDNKQIEIDEDIIPVINWLNQKGAKTLFSCQGNVRTQRLWRNENISPYVLWKCKNQDILIDILETFQDWQFHDAIQNVAHKFHTVTTEVDAIDGIRYHSKWFDNLALKDFIEWANLS